MRVPSIGVLIFFALVSAEAIAYSAAIINFGLLASLLFGILSFACGTIILRRLGLQLGQLLSENIDGGRIRWVQFRSLGWIVAAAILLILPGFLTNLVGFVIALFHLRLLISTSVPTGDVDRQVIDLEETEWSVTEKSRGVQRPTPIETKFDTNNPK